MKIEIGESLFYSWLRHVKSCQIVQTNWKVSPQWELHNENKLERLMVLIDKHFSEKYGYHIFKKNTSLRQLMQQGECDVLGVDTKNGKSSTFAVDIAFHESGLNYGDRSTTVMKVLEKCTRTAFCLYGYMDTSDAEIVFASPKINPAILNNLEPCIKDLNDIFDENGFHFIFSIISNEEFNNKVLQPILDVSRGISDTAELFLRSYQLFGMFACSEEKEQLTKKRVSIKEQNYDRDSISDAKKHNMLLIAYCFSEYGHEVLYPHLNQDKAFEEASDKIGIKKNTLKNNRDYFDGHNNSPRKGWYQEELPLSLQEFKDSYSGKTKNEVIKEAKCVLALL